MQTHTTTAAAATQKSQQTRGTDRKPVQKSIICSLTREKTPSERYLAMAVDMSSAGIGIFTDYPLSPGHPLWFNDGSGEKEGEVRWCLQQDDGYRAGIAFTASHISYEHIQGSAPLVRDRRQQYFHLLDNATDTFMRSVSSVDASLRSDSRASGTYYHEVCAAIDTVLEACKEFEHGIADHEQIRGSRVAFHVKTNPQLSKSHHINRVRTWPQGYQGDYKTLEIAYRNTPLSDGLGYYLDQYTLNVELAHAIRKRVAKLSSILGDELSARSNPAVLNIACGSCRELMKVVPEIAGSGAEVICVDSDGDALSFSQERFSRTEVFEQIEFRKYNALRLFDEEMNESQFGKQDLIYSLGLFDYLPTDFLVKMFRSLYLLLKPGGKFIAAFKDAGRYRHQDYHWMFDWDGFQQRYEDEFLSIIKDAGVPKDAVENTRDETGIISFYVITR